MSAATSIPPAPAGRRRALLTTLVVAAVGFIAASSCGADPFDIKWSSTKDTVLLYSLARPELGLPSGFSFNNRVSVLIERVNVTGYWDMAVDTRDGSIVILPPGALGVPGKARVTALTGTTFDDVVEAPADTSLYTATEAVPVRMGTVYVIRTNQSVGSFGTYCVYYAKLAPVEIDPEGGTLRFFYDTSPVCNDRALVPKN